MKSGSVVEECTEGVLEIGSLNLTQHGEELACKADNGISPQGQLSIGLLVQSNSLFMKQMLWL